MLKVLILPTRRFQAADMGMGCPLDFLGTIVGNVLETGSRFLHVKDTFHYSILKEEEGAYIFWMKQVPVGVAEADLTQLRGKTICPPPSVVFSTNKNWLPQYNWNIVESGVKNHNP